MRISALILFAQLRLSSLMLLLPSDDEWRLSRSLGNGHFSACGCITAYLSAAHVIRDCNSHDMMSSQMASNDADDK